MKPYEIFNYDILAIIIIISNFVFGYYYGFFRQLKKAIKVLLCFLFLHFFLDKIVNILINISFINNIKQYLFGKLNYSNLIFTIIIGIAIYIICYSILSLILKLFSFKREKKIIKTNSFISKITGSFISLINTYFYLMILLYAMGALSLTDTSRPIAKNVSSLNIDLFDISELNLYQTTMATDYIDIQSSLAKISGQTAYNEYLNIKEIYEKLENLNIYFTNVLIPNISETSKKRIENVTFDGNYVLGLMQMGKKKTIFHYILLDEINNTKYDEFNVKYQTLLKLRGYVFFFYETLDKDIDQYTFEELYVLLRAERFNIMNNFTSQEEQIKFNNSFLELKFYMDNKDDILKLIDNDTSCSLEKYTTEMEKVLSLKHLLEKFIANYIKTYTKEKINKLSDNNYKKIFNVIRSAFLLHDDNKLLFDSLNNNYTYAEKIILIKDYDGFFKTHKWENNILINNYMSGVVTSKSLEKKLFIDYLIYEYLLKTDGLIDIDTVENGLIKLKDLSNTNLISDEARFYIIEEVFTEESGIIYSLQSNGSLDDNLINQLLSKGLIIAKED